MTCSISFVLMVRLFRSIPQQQGMTLGFPLSPQFKLPPLSTPILTLPKDKPPHRCIRRHTRKARSLRPRNHLTSPQSRTLDLRNRHKAQLSRSHLRNIRRNNDSNCTASRSRPRLHGNLRRQLRRPKDDGLRQGQRDRTEILAHRSA